MRRCQSSACFETKRLGEAYKYYPVNSPNSLNNCAAPLLKGPFDICGQCRLKYWTVEQNDNFYNVRKPPFWYVNPTKTQIGLYMTVVWSESSFQHKETLHPWLSRMHTVKILIRLRECAVWSESSLETHVQRYVFWRAALIDVLKYFLFFFFFQKTGFEISCHLHEMSKPFFLGD